MTIPTFKKGQKLLATDLQALADAVRANRILPGVGIRITGSPNGTTVAANIRRAAAGAKDRHVWQPYPAPFTGTGTPPPNQAFKIRIIPGDVNGVMPTNRGLKITIPASQSDGYFVWLKASLGTSLYNPLQDLVYEHGAEGPPDLPEGNSETGAPPNVTYKLLFWVVTDDTGITEIYQLCKNSLWLSLQMVDIECQTSLKNVAWLNAG